MSSDVIFVYQEDPDCRSEVRIADLQVGDSFIFRGKMFRKRNDMGWAMGVCNCFNAQGEFCHIHPSTHVTMVQ